MNRRILAVILALVFVLTVVPTTVFIGLRGRAEGEEIQKLEPVSMTVIANGRTFTTAEVPAGNIRDNLENISFGADLPNGCTFEKALVVGRDGTETPISSVGRLGEVDYYSVGENSSTGTALDPENQTLTLVYSAEYTVNLTISEGGILTTNAKPQGGSDIIRGGTDLVIQSTPHRDYKQGTVTYKIGQDGETKTLSINNGTATISNLSIYDDIFITANYTPVTEYTVQDARYMTGSKYYPELQGIDNHGGTTQTVQNGGKEGVDNVSKGGTATFLIYSESNTGGNEWLLNKLSINGMDIEYPYGVGNITDPYTFPADSPALAGSTVTVRLAHLDEYLRWKSGDYSRIFGQQKYRTIYVVNVTDVHEDLEIAYNFKEKQSREIIMKDLRGIAETGAAKEERGENVYVIAETRNYKLNKTTNNIYPAYYNDRYRDGIGITGAGWIPSANLYLYRVKPGFNPYSVSDNIHADYINDDTGATTAVDAEHALSGTSSAGAPVDVIKAASNQITAEIQAALQEWTSNETIQRIVGDVVGAIRNWDSFIRFWGPSSELNNNNDTAYRRRIGIGTENEPLLLQSIIDEERNTTKKWYAIALNQREETNQQLYLYATPYQYRVVVDLDIDPNDDAPITDSRYTGSGAILTENAYHTLENGDTYAVLPATAPSKSGYVFDGYQLYKDDEPVPGMPLYQANEQFPITEVTVDYATGDEQEDEDHIFTLKAQWTRVDEAPTTKTSVDVYVQVPASQSEDPDVELDSSSGKYYKHVVDHAVETQVAGAEAVLLDRHNPENAEFYEIREDSVVAIEELEHLGITGNVPSENEFVVHWDIIQADLNVQKEVVGRLKRNEFPITITLTPPQGYPFTLAETRSFMSLSNNEALGNIKIEDGKLVYTKNFVNGADVTLFNAPGGWTYTVEENVSGNEFETFISNGTEELEGRTFSRILTTEDTNVVVRNQRKYDDPSLETDKWLTKTDDGYDLTMEAYATAQSITEETTNTTPLDIVLVIDQSGSMGYADMNPTFEPTEKTSWTAKEAAGTDITYYYKVGDGDDAVYYPVQSEVGPLYAPTTTTIKKVLGTGHDTIGAAVVFTPHYNIPTSYYAFGSDNEMHKVYGISVGQLAVYSSYLYYYNDQRDASSEWSQTLTTSVGWDKTYLTNNQRWSDLVSHGKVTYVDDITYRYAWRILGIDLRNDTVNGLYKIVESAAPNRLYYVDDNGEKQYLSDQVSITEDDIAYNGNLYQVSGGTKRIDALKTAANAFVEKVAQNASENRIQHRIAVTGFAGNATPGISLENGVINYSGLNYGYDYVNTGLFDNGTFYNYEEITGYERISSSNSNNSSLMDPALHYYIDYNGAPGGKAPIVYLQGAWRRINQANGTYTTISNVNAINVYRPTYRGLGNHYSNAFMDVTENDGTINQTIIDTIDSFGSYGATYTSYGVSMANSVFEANPSNDRDKVVVVFTDGEPGKYGYDSAIAGEALYDAQQLKNQGVKVYSVGLFVGNPSSDIDTFMSNMSSEGTTTATPVSSANLDPNKTYWYYDSNKKKAVSVSTVHNGESTIGWWTDESPSRKVYHTDDDSDESIPSDQKFTFYNSKNESAFNTTSISDIDISRTYYIVTGHTGFIITTPTWAEIKYKVSWYNSENEIVSPDNHQFFELTNSPSGDTNSYYFHSDNPAGLNQIFESISQTITTTYNTVQFDDSNALLRDTITADFDLPNTENELKQITKIEIVDVDHYEADGTPVFKATGQDVTADYQNNIHWTINGDGTKTIDIEGFDYATNYVSKTRENDPDNKGKKIVVTLEGLTPNKTGGTYDSNTDDSGLYRKASEDSEEKFIDAFPIPSISRYKYELVVGPEDESATFNIDFQFQGYAEDGTPIALTDDLDFGGITFGQQDGVANWNTAAADGDSIIFEQILTSENNSGVQHGDEIPDNYTISTNVGGKTSDEYKYTMKLNDTEPKDFDEYYDMPKADATINISSDTKKYPVTVIKQVRPKEGDPDYTDKTKKFDIVITLYDKDGQTAAPEGLYDGIEFETSGGKTTASISLSNDEREMFNVPYGYYISLNEDDSARLPYEDSYWDGATDVTADAETDAIYPVTKIGEGAIGKDIIVLNTLEAPDIDSGVLDSNNPFGIILAVLAAICGIAAAGTMIYTKKRKKEEG